MSDLSPHETQARILEKFAASFKHPMTEDRPLLDALTAGAQALRQLEKNDDHGAALLPADPSASVNTEPLPNSDLDECECGHEKGLHHGACQVALCECSEYREY